MVPYRYVWAMNCFILRTGSYPCRLLFLAATMYRATLGSSNIREELLVSAASLLSFLKSGVAICTIGVIHLCFGPPDSALSLALFTSLLDLLIFNYRNSVTLHLDSFWSDLPEGRSHGWFFFFFEQWILYICLKLYLDIWCLLWFIIYTMLRSTYLYFYSFPL